MARKDLQEREKELWAQWKAGDSKALPDLFKSFRPVENAWYGKVAAQNLPESAVRGEIKKLMFEAFETYNPGKGAQLGTYVNSRMPKLYRYVSERQNIGRIPEHRALKITSFNTAKDLLSDRLGRDPNATELADELAWDLREVERMTKDLRKDIVLSQEFEDFSFHDTSQKQQILNLAYYELDPREKKVFEWTVGFGGKRKKSTQEIAQKLGVSVPTIGNIRKKIAKKIERYMK